VNETNGPEPLLHKERLTPQGWPTGYALCDTGDGTFEGGLLANNSGTATCEKCIDWEDGEDEPESDAPEVIPFPGKRPDDVQVTDRCECGAPAALSVGYEGESGPVLQCVRCATADPRTPFFHRKLNGYPL